MNMQQRIETGRHYHLLVYDVPNRATLRPPALLHRVAVRINWSCWLVPEQNLPRIPVKEWLAAGADVEVTPWFDTASPADAETMLRLAHKGLRVRIKEVREALRAAVGRAAFKYDLARGDVMNELFLKKADGLSYWALRRARLALAAAQEAAVAFDLTGDFAEAFEAVGQAIRSESELLAGKRREVVLTKAEREARAKFEEARS